MIEERTIDKIVLSQRLMEVVKDVHLHRLQREQEYLTHPCT